MLTFVQVFGGLNLTVSFITVPVRERENVINILTRKLLLPKIRHQKNINRSLTEVFTELGDVAFIKL